MVASYHSGDPVSSIASRFGVSVNTVYKWLKRHRQAGTDGLLNRPSKPLRAGRAHPEGWHKLVVWLRRALRMTAARIANHLNLPRSTVARWLKTLGLARQRDLDTPVPIRRYQHACPGDMIHIDIKKLGRFSRVGHRITGRRNNREGAGRQGWEFVHVAVDDTTRLAYVEVLPDEKQWTAAAFLVRATRWFRERGIKVRRVMTDNGACYKSRVFTRTCQRIAARHIRTRPYTPQTNGKAERFIQILIREWAYGSLYPTSDARAADLPRWLDWYNSRRPHGAHEGRSPRQALNNVMGNHT